MLSNKIWREFNLADKAKLLNLVKIKLLDGKNAINLAEFIFVVIRQIFFKHFFP